MSVRALGCCLLALLCQIGLAKDLKVPQQYATIQSAIDSASTGDTVLVSGGIYKGAGNVDLDFRGKAITIEGEGYLSTIIDGENRSQGFIFHSGEAANSVIRSLTIKHCRADAGAAISISNASPMIQSCSLEDCVSTSGGAVYISSGNPSFQSVTFSRDHAPADGGAVFSDHASPVFIGCTFQDTDTKGEGGALALNGGSPSISSSIFKNGNADFGGGAIAAFGSALTIVNTIFTGNTASQNAGTIDISNASSAVLTNCTLAANLSHRGAGGLRVADTSKAKIQNSILWTDEPNEIDGKATLCWSCITGGHPGNGNTDEDPKLVDAVGQDLHLEIGSPCIDTANPSLVSAKQDLEGRARSIGTGPDMGAYEYPITKPNPQVTTTSKTVFTVPHDGNPVTDTANVHLQASGYDELLGVLSFQWSVDNEVVGTAPTLDTTMEPGQKRFDLVVRDAQGDMTKSSIYVTVLPEPNQRPVANGGPDQTIKANGSTAHVILNGHGFDGDGDPLTYLWSTGDTTQSIAEDLSPGNYAFTFKVTDPYGASDTATVHVHILDGVAPKVVLNGTTPMSLEVFSKFIDPGATATDEMDGSNLAVHVQGAVNCKKLGSNILTYTATDSSGNVGSATRTVNVVDTTAPVITLNGANPMSIDCSHGYSEPGASATDNYDGSVPVTISGAVPSTAGTYTVTYAATDSSHNTATATRTVIVHGSAGPVITLNGSNPMTLECAKGYTEPGASAKDGCSGAPIPVTISGSVSGKVGAYTITYSATDSNGNTATSTRTVIVSDTTAPVITLNGSNPLTIECGSGYIEPGATATDSCDGNNVPVKISGIVPTKTGTYSVTYTATDNAGNKATVSRTVTVSDTTAPVIKLNGANPMIVECGTGYVEPGATATDACDGVGVPVTISGTVSSAKGSYTVAYTAKDSAGNKSTCTRTVKVVDTTPPVITLNGAATVTVECGTGYTELGALATDTCDGPVPVTTSGSVSGAKGTYTVTYTATDSSGNTANATRKVIISDSTAPVITLKGSNPMTVECGTGYAEPGATATDSCDGNGIAVSISGSVPAAKGTYTVTYTAKDSSGNTATANRTVIVSDTKAPNITITGANPMTVECGQGYTELGATATDSCDGTVTVSISGSVPTTKGTYTVTYTAKDSSGNTATATRTVNVTDTKAPTITLKGSNPMTVDLATGTYVEPGATATDSCDGTVSVTITGSVPSVIGAYTVTYTAKDSSGNTATATRTVNVISSAGPSITGLIASPGSLNSQNQKMKTINLTYTVVDPNDPAPTITVTATSSDPDSGVFPGDLPGDIVIDSTTAVDLRQEHAPGGQRTYTITVAVTDKFGKTASASVTVIAK